MASNPCSVIAGDDSYGEQQQLQQLRAENVVVATSEIVRDVADTYSLDSASSIGGVSRASLLEPDNSETDGDELTTSSKLTSKSEDGDVSSDSGRLTAVAEIRACGGDRRASDHLTLSSRSSPGSDDDVSSKEEAPSVEESPKEVVDDLRPGPCSRMVSIIGELPSSTTVVVKDEASDLTEAEPTNGSTSTTTLTAKSASTKLETTSLTDLETASTTSTTDSTVSSTPWAAKMFRVAYLGNSVMDRRYPTDLQPWVMAELKRIGTTTPVVLSAISGGSVLHALPATAVQGAVEVMVKMVLDNLRYLDIAQDLATNS